MIMFEKTNPTEIHYLGERINYNFFFLIKKMTEMYVLL